MPPTKEPHWPPLLTVFVAIVLQFLLPDRLVAGPHWLLPVAEAVLLVALAVSAPQHLTGPHSLRRKVTLTITGLASVANGISLVLLCDLLLRTNVSGGHRIVVAGALIWLTNVLVLSLWYWELDGGGPGRRAIGSDDPPDFLFPLTNMPDLRPGWRPLFADYLYVSLTNATAFSPTDTMPLSITAKMIMGMQSLISLITIGLVIARAVNIL